MENKTFFFYNEDTKQIEKVTPCAYSREGIPCIKVYNKELGIITISVKLLSKTFNECIAKSIQMYTEQMYSCMKDMEKNKILDGLEMLYGIEAKGHIKVLTDLLIANQNTNQI